MSIPQILRKLLKAFLVAAASIMGVALAFSVGATLYGRAIEVQDRVAASPRSGRFVEAYDCRLYVQTLGGADAPAVIFIPGTGAWSAMWRPYMEQVSALGYQAIAIDLPPFGYSIPPASGNYSKVEQSKRILGVMDSLGIHQATFVAHSIGAAPLMEALLAQPFRASRAILVAPALGLDSAPPGRPEPAWHRLLRQTWFTEPLTAGLLTNPLFTRPLVQHFVVEKDRITPEWVDLYRQPFRLDGSYQNIARWIPALTAGRTFIPSDQPDSYQQIAYPVTLIWGRDDFITPLTQGEHLHNLIPHSRLLLLPGGHVPMIEEPQTFAADLAEALSER